MESDMADLQSKEKTLKQLIETLKKEKDIAKE